LEVAALMPQPGSYGFLGRAIHRFAFAHPVIQKSLSDLENDLFRSRIAGVEVREPVFITGLPRAGTTLLLDLLYRTGEFAAHTYRNMPFVMTPLLWRRFSAGFGKSAEVNERAHGDGMTVSYDSPEAFEEAVWLLYLGRDILARKRIRTLSAADVTEEFGDVLALHMRKLIAAHDSDDGSGQLRYLSKNNANISRLPALRHMFPDSKILVAFREPLAHIGSLMRQHGRFLEIHAADEFSRKYMGWVGHREFGADFAPIEFPGLQEVKVEARSVSAEFWLRYWTSAYGMVLSQMDAGIQLVDFDALVTHGRGSLSRLADRIGVANSFLARTDVLRAPTSTPVPPDRVPTELLNEARSVHEELKRRSVDE
jgi:hypothetical protein